MTEALAGEPEKDGIFKMVSITAKVARGRNKGTPLVPHRYDDGTYKAALSRFDTDPHVRVGTVAELLPWIRQGYGIRMSAPGLPPSLIAPGSLDIEA